MGRHDGLTVHVPVDVLEKVLFGPDCHCWSNGRHPDGTHATVCHWGVLLALYQGVYR